MTRPHARRVLASLGVLCALGSCSSRAPITIPAPPVPGAKADQTPLEYLDTALTVIQAEDVFSAAGDWTRLHRQADSHLTRTPSLQQARVEILSVLSALGPDGHASVFSPLQWKGAAASISPTGPIAVPTGRLLGTAVGYINVPGVGAYPTTAAARRYATAGLDAWTNLRRQGARSWIVDLRSDTGGDMHPMLVALGPILGHGKLIGFGTLHGPSSWTTYRSFATFQDTRMVMRAPTRVSLPEPPPRVAVLVGRQTASAGEATAIALIGRPHTRSFGQKTAGATTSPAFHTLSDGWVLGFAAFLDYDRTGKSYRVIQPDQVIAPSYPADAQGLNGESALNRDPTVDAARRWLEGSTL